MTVLTSGDIARSWRVSPRTARRWAAQGRVPAARLGRAWRVLAPLSPAILAARSAVARARARLTRREVSTHSGGGRGDARGASRGPDAPPDKKKKGKGVVGNGSHPLVRVFVGWDPREALAARVAGESVRAHAARPVVVGEVRLAHLAGVLRRPRHPLQSTEFAFSRWLVPWVCGFKGWAVFVDGDVLCRADIGELWDLRDSRYAVMVVKHQHVPAEAVKMDGQAQTPYPRKNWSSVMLFNNARCGALSPAYVSAAAGLDLHQFRWCGDEEIGELPARWNHLVGYDAPRPDAALVHFTSGGPWFPGYESVEYADEWRAARDALTEER